MAKNTHGVPKAQWRKWNRMEQAAFNRLWHRIAPNVLKNVLGAKAMTQKECNVLRWNLCWMVADMMKDWRGFWCEEICKCPSK